MFCTGCSKPLNPSRRIEIAGFGDPFKPRKYQIDCPDCFEENFFGEDDFLRKAIYPQSALVAMR